MDIDECKAKVIDITTDIGVMVPYETGQMPDDWSGLSNYLAELASTIGHCVTRIASYSAIASRKAK